MMTDNNINNAYVNGLKVAKKKLNFYNKWNKKGYQEIVLTQVIKDLEEIVDALKIKNQ